MVNKINNDDVLKFVVEFEFFKYDKSLSLLMIIDELVAFSDKHKEIIDVKRMNRPYTAITQLQFSCMFGAYFSGRIFNKEQITYAYENCGYTTKDFQGAKQAGAQYGYPIYSEGLEIEDYVLKAGEYCYVYNSIPKKYFYLKRKGKAKASGDECICCGSKKGETNRRDGTITRIENAHKDFRLAATTDNMVAICHYCNSIYKTEPALGIGYIFLPNGAPIAVAIS